MRILSSNAVKQRRISGNVRFEQRTAQFAQGRIRVVTSYTYKHDARNNSDNKEGKYVENQCAKIFPDKCTLTLAGMHR